MTVEFWGRILIWLIIGDFDIENTSFKKFVVDKNSDNGWSPEKLRRNFVNNVYFAGNNSPKSANSQENYFGWFNSDASYLLKHNTILSLKNYVMIFLGQVLNFKITQTEENV